jgi:hypothetical protein
MAASKIQKPAAQVGDIVLYSGRSGQVLPALVLMTPETFDHSRDGYVAAPGEGELSLEIHRLSGRTYVRHGVPLEGSEAHQALVEARALYEANGSTDARADEGEGWESPAKPPVVRSWKPRG